MAGKYSPDDSKSLARHSASGGYSPERSGIAEDVTAGNAEWLDPTRVAGKNSSDNTKPLARHSASGGYSTGRSGFAEYVTAGDAGDTLREKIHDLQYNFC